MRPEVFPEDPNDRLPDFIIGGAMKSGTSTFEHLLKKHPRISIPDDCKAFFNFDNFAQHRDFYPQIDSDWTYHDIEKNFETYYNWYQTFFEDVSNEKVAGEVTQIYLASQRVPERIKRVIPEVKLIFLLRDPVDRTFSHYLHRVRTGKAIFDFERTVKYAPDGLLQRSFYREQLERYFDVFARDNIKVIVFERFIDEMDTVMGEVFDFLGLDHKIELDELQTHKHKAKVPRSVTFQTWLNYIFRDLNTNRYADQLPNMPDSTSRPVQKLFYRAFSSLNLTRDRDPSPMDEGTRQFLQNVLARENSGLGNLLGRDLEAYWSGF